MNQLRVSLLNERSRLVSPRAARWRLLFALMLLAAALAPMAPRFSAPAGAIAPSTDLALAVQSAAARATGTSPEAVIVDIVEQTDAWAFGTAVIPAGDSDTPVVKFFLAHHETIGAWTVALRFTDGFTALLASAPADFPSAELRGALDGVFSLAAGGDAQLSFPFPEGETWYFQGPHMGPPHTSLDFSTGPFDVADAIGPVVAMRGGTVYRPCAGMVMIDHGDGWATGYYHVDPIIVTNGQVVARGQEIGKTSKNYACGGYASSNHVHVWTEYRGEHMPIAGQVIGGWTVEDGPVDYFGCLVKGTERRCSNDLGELNHYVTNEGDIGTGGPGAVDIVGATGIVGEPLDFTLTAFPANSAVSMIWKRPGGSTVDLGPVTTNGGGSYSGQLTIPATTNGDGNTITFTSGTNSRTVHINVIPAVTATPQTVASGDTLTLTVSGFPKKQTVNLDLTTDVGGAEALGTLVTSNTGGGTLTVTVPAGLETGQMTVQALAPGGIVALRTIQIANDPAILAPTTGQRVGAPFSFGLAGFPSGAVVTVDIRNAGTGTVVATLPEVTVNTGGNATGSGTWPIAPAGQFRIVATSSGATAERLISLNPALVTPPGTVQRGASVTLTAHGMTPGSAVSFTWQTVSTPVTLGSIQADTNGTGTIQITVPAAPDGSMTLVATAAGGASTFGAIEIAGGPMPGPASASISPVRGTVNTWVSLSVANFPANSSVQVKWIRPSGGSIDVATLQTDGSGTASGSIRVPATPGGMNGVRFTSGSVTKTVPYEVVARIKVTPSVTERGETVNVSLRGYGRQEVVRIRWKKGSSWVELGQVTTSNTGSANINVTVPDWAPDGAASVRGDGTVFRAQTNAVTVSGGTTLSIAGLEATPSPSPTVTTSPTASPEPTASPTETEVPAVTPTEPAPGTETPTPEPTTEETPATTAEPTETATPEPPTEPTATVDPAEPTVSGDGAETSG